MQEAIVVALSSFCVYSLIFGRDSLVNDSLVAAICGQLFGVCDEVYVSWEMKVDWFHMVQELARFNKDCLHTMGSPGQNLPDRFQREKIVAEDDRVRLGAILQPPLRPTSARGLEPPSG